MAENQNNRREWYELMVRDSVRMRAYRRALDMYAPGRVVVDVGAGWGHLSRWALDAGASRAILIEQDEAALAIAQETLATEYEGRAEFIKASSFDVKVAEGRADVVVAEVFDSTGVGENALAILADARRFLKPGGIIIPNAIALHVALIMSGDWPVVSEPNKLTAADIDADGKDRQPWHNWIPDTWTPIHVRETGRAYGLAFAFSLTLAPGVWLTNLPGHAPTHWRQGALQFATPLDVDRGEVLMLRGHVKKSVHVDKCDVNYEIGRAAR